MSQTEWQCVQCGTCAWSPPDDGVPFGRCRCADGGRWRAVFDKTRAIYVRTRSARNTPVTVSEPATVATRPPKAPGAKRPVGRTTRAKKTTSESQRRAERKYYQTHRAKWYTVCSICGKASIRRGHSRCRDCYLAAVRGQPKAIQYTLREAH